MNELQSTTTRAARYRCLSFHMTHFLFYTDYRCATRLLIACFALSLVGACTSREAGPPPDMVLVPAGEFIMGSNKVDADGLQQRYGLTKPLYVDEHPQQKRLLPSYYIDRLEVSNAQYKAYVRAKVQPEPFEWTQNGYNLLADRLQATDVDTLRWIATDYFKLDADTKTMDKPALLKLMFDRQAELDRLPVTGVSWFDAQAYCAWNTKRLPTESEWEKAARGPEGLEFPWGNTWDPDVINAGDTTQWEDGIAPVGTYETSKSPYGVYDMAGNVWEWTADWYKPYPGSTLTDPNFGETKRVIRGGGGGIGHYAISEFFRSAARQFADPKTTGGDIGFRCAKDAR